LAALYETDETAWLDAMAELIREGRPDDVDFPHLAEYLEDMARRDRKEVKSRLRILLAHLLKWTHQPEKRSNSWRGTITTQRHELEDDLLTSGTLRNHAEAILPETYAQAVEQAVDETGLPDATFPPQCPWKLDQLLSAEVLGD
jgi:ferredoxin-NADP reductase